MPRTPRVVAYLGLGLVLAAGIGCVSAYDPSGPSRLGLTTRAEEVGTAYERPARVKVKPVPPPTRVAQASPGVTNPEGGPAPAPRVAPPAHRPSRPKPQPASQPQAQPTTAAAQPTAPAPQAAPAPAPPPAIAFPETPAGEQLRWFVGVLGGSDTKKLADHFNPAFLEKVPAARVIEIVRQWRRDQLANGPVELVRLESESTPTSLVAIVRGKVTDKYTQIRLGVDGEAKIKMLWLGPVADMQRGAIPTWGKLDGKLEALPGAVSFAAYELKPGAEGQAADLRAVHAFGSDQALGIGSTFKLYILGALAEQVAAGKIKWEDELPIKDDLKSLPSGQMQLEAEDALFPISRYADLMISISDNTAADHLLAKVGRENVEAYMAKVTPDAAKRNRPFLSTMELFKLKLGADRTLAGRFAAASETERRAMLAPGGDVEKASPSLAAAAMWKAPYEIEKLEWFATAQDLCRVMADLHRLEQLPGMEPLAHALRINPGLQFDRQLWKSVAYKGGSEPGVLNMTWLLERKDGRWFVVSVGWNDPKKDVDIQAMAELAGAAVGLIGAEE